MPLNRNLKSFNNINDTNNTNYTASPTATATTNKDSGRRLNNTNSPNSSNSSNGPNSPAANTSAPHPIVFPTSPKCPRCGRSGVPRMLNNNPLLSNTPTLCFSCLSSIIDPANLDQVDLFCRTYNLPFKPDLWLSLSSDDAYTGPTLFQVYTRIVLEDPSSQPNLAYTSSTHDLWLRTTKEWSKTRTFTEILSRLEPLRDSYTTRGQLKWGTQYTFEDLLRLDSIYTRTLKANNITNPLQKEAVKTLCKLQLQLDAAIQAGDSKGIKDYSTAWGTFAKQADLENMIAETRTSDITNVSELSDYLERTGFQPTFYDGFPRDEVDTALKDMSATLVKTINESTSIQPLLEEMARKRAEAAEQQKTKEATDATTLQDLRNYHDDGSSSEPEAPEQEDDSEVTSLDFSDDDANDATALSKTPIKISHKDANALLKGTKTESPDDPH